MVSYKIKIFCMKIIGRIDINGATNIYKIAYKTTPFCMKIKINGRINNVLIFSSFM
jgi:hypothetical protein